MYQLQNFHSILVYRDQFEREYPESLSPCFDIKSAVTARIKKSILEIFFKFMFSKTPEKHFEPG